MQSPGTIIDHQTSAGNQTGLYNNQKWSFQLNCSNQTDLVWLARAYSLNCCICVNCAILVTSLSIIAPRAVTRCNNGPIKLPLGTKLVGKVKKNGHFNCINQTDLVWLARVNCAIPITSLFLSAQSRGTIMDPLNFRWEPNLLVR